MEARVDEDEPVPSVASNGVACDACSAPIFVKNDSNIGDVNESRPSIRSPISEEFLGIAGIVVVLGSVWDIVGKWVEAPDGVVNASSYSPR